MNSFLRNIILLLCLSFCNTAIAQSPAFEHYTVNDGLAHNRCYMITQDKAGFLYFATENGLSRFDGFNFKTYTDTIMQDIDVLICKIGPDDKVWFRNLSGELFYLEDELITRFNPDSLLENSYILNFYFQDEDLIIVNKFNSVLIFDDSLNLLKNLSFESKIGSQVSSALKLNNDEFYFSQLPGFIKYTFSNNKFEKFAEEVKDCFVLSNSFNNSIIAHSNIPGSKLYLIKEKHIEELKLKEFSDEKKVIIATKLIDNKLWIATTNGCFVYDSTYTHINKKGILKDQFITDTFIDDENNYWVSTHENGIFKMLHSSLKNYNIANSDLSSNNIFSIIKSSENEIVLGLGNGEIQYLINDQLNKSVSVKNDHERILHLNYLNKNQLMVAGDGQFKIINSNTSEILNIEFITQNKPLFKSKQYFKRVLRNVKTTETYANNLWLGTSNFLYQGNLSLDTLDQTNEARYSDLKFLKDTLFIGTDNGLMYAVDDSINNEYYLGIEEHISKIETDKDGNLFIGTQGAGLYKISKGKYEKFTSENGLISNSIKSMSYDENTDILWFGTSNGLHSLKDNKIKLYNTQDGLVSNQINAILCENQKIYIGTNQGLSILPSNFDNTNITAPNLYFNSVQVMESDTTLLSKYSLNYDQNNIKINFNAINFKNNDRLNYKYQLSGIDKKWVHSKYNQASYPSLPNGEYVFQAIAINSDGIESTEPIKIEFLINPPFWQTWWFKLVCFALICLSIYSFFKYRLNSINKNTRLKEQVEREISELKLQTLHAQMNPHFIFNSMNAIQNFISSNQQQLAINYLSKLSRLIRTVFEFSKQQTISLEEEINFLKNYISLEEMRFGEKAKGIIKVDEKINSENYEISPMLIQPIVENAFKHGLFHKGEKGTVTINFTKTKTGLKITVEDNGVGRAATKTINNNKAENHKSSGLSITRERLKSLNDILIKSSSLNVIDLIDENNIAKGTKVNMHLNYIS